MFYPFAFSGTCTAELCQIRDDLGSFENDDVQVLAISTDTAQSLKAWSLAQGYTFPLLSDFWPHGEVARAYGVFNEALGCAMRGTFVIGKDGRIVDMFESPDLATPRDKARYTEALTKI